MQISINQTQRNGVSSIELIVSAVLLMTVMSFMTTLCVRIDRVWKDISQQRVAVAELSNQLERLTLLPVDKIVAAIDGLEPSENCAMILPHPVLRGEIADDNLGRRITLKIHWQRQPVEKSVELSGWLMRVPAKPEEEQPRLTVSP